MRSANHQHSRDRDQRTNSASGSPETSIVETVTSGGLASMWRAEPRRQIQPLLYRLSHVPMGSACKTTNRVWSCASRCGHTQGRFRAGLSIEGHHNRLPLTDVACVPATGNDDQRTVTRGATVSDRSSKNPVPPRHVVAAEHQHLGVSCGELRPRAGVAGRGVHIKRAGMGRGRAVTVASGGGGVKSCHRFTGRQRWGRRTRDKSQPRIGNRFRIPRSPPSDLAEPCPPRPPRVDCAMSPLRSSLPRTRRGGLGGLLQ